MFRLKGGHLWKHVENKHTDVIITVCADMPFITQCWQLAMH